MRVSNKDCSPGAIHRCNTAPTETGVAEIFSEYREKVVKFSLASRRTFRYNTDFSSPNAVRNSAYGRQV